MTETLAPTAGIDIAKDRLDVALHPAGDARQFANDQRGHGKLLRWLGKRAVACVVFEATGSYGRELERRLQQAAVPFARVNPRHARRFAEATGRLAKTDRVDARMLARFGAVLEPECRPLRSETLDQLAELVAARRALVKDRTAILNRQKTLRVTLLARQAARRLTQIDAQIKAIDAAAQLAWNCSAVDTVEGLNPRNRRSEAFFRPVIGGLQLTARWAKDGLGVVSHGVL